MKITLIAIFSLLLASVSMQARQQDTVFVSDYGIRPYTYENQTGRLRAVIDDCKGRTPKCLCLKRALRFLAGGCRSQGIFYHQHFYGAGMSLESKDHRIVL